MTKSKHKDKQKYELRYKEGEKITSRAGLGVIGNIYEELKIDKLIENNLPNGESWNSYKASKYVKAIVTMLLSGGQYIEDVGRVMKDKGLTDMVGIKAMPSSDAIGDWLKRDSKKKVGGLKIVIEEITGEVIKRDKRKEYTLDIDATGIESWKKEAKWTYKGHKGYMPILGYISELEICIEHEFREGNISPCTRNKELVEESVKIMKRQGKKIGYVRIDGAGYSNKVMGYCEKEGIKYTISASKNENIKEHIIYLYC